MAKHIATVAHFGDTHCGGDTALLPPRWKLPGGQTITQSRAQGWMWDRWLDYVGKLKDEAKRVPILGVVNGDIVEGKHHDMTQLAAAEPEDHAAIAVDVLDLALAQCRASVFIEGTNAHAGRQGRTENIVAMLFARDGKNIITPPDTSLLIWPVANVNFHGINLNIAHHGRVSGNERTRNNAANGEAADQVFEAMLSAHEQGLKSIVPDYCLRNHAHRMSEGYYMRTRTRLLGAGCWQLSTSHGHKGFAHRPPDVGAWMIRVFDDRSTSYEEIRYPVLREQRFYTEVSFGTPKTDGTGDTAGANTKRTAKPSSQRQSGRSRGRGASGHSARIRSKAQGKRRASA